MSSKHLLLSLPKVTEVTFRIRDLTITNGDRLTLATDTPPASSACWLIVLIAYVNNALDGILKDSIKVLVSFQGGQRTSPYDCLMPRDTIDVSLYRSMHLVPVADATKTLSFPVGPSGLSSGKSVEGCISQESLRTSPNRNKAFAKMVDDAVRQATAVATTATTGTTAPTATAAARRRTSIVQRTGTRVNVEPVVPVEFAPRITYTPRTTYTHLATLNPLTILTPLPTPATDTEDTKNRSSTLTLVIEKHSLATFCTLLRFVYTGQIDYSNRYSDFVLSVHNIPISTNTSSPSPFLQSRDSSSIRWTQLPDEKLVWTVAKEEHLMLCAREFGIDDLAAGCQARMELLMSEANIGHILFDVVPVYPEIKVHAMAYVIRNKEKLFASGKDLFAQFRAHPQCHSVMMEIFQLMASSE
ncbi:hypothetical protein BGZ95_004554 [Linnemannia exigua]|uniref:BTB domain-containing protein n=1 Tax=Linnemannia exigua TaxID=604196 RepID=A0AAD4H7Z3_9FUNG|nr:hypothetical protein BGZ95_004554 [Linnemannia exigua]